MWPYSGRWKSPLSQHAESGAPSDGFGRILVLVRDVGTLAGIALILLFPILTALLSLAFPGASEIGLWDAGAQRPPARSLFRLLLILTCLSGLLLPLTARPRQGWRDAPWAGLFVLSGLISVLWSGRPYHAFTEWETWALLLTMAVIGKRFSIPYLPTLFLGCLYLVSSYLVLHAVWIGVPSSSSRLGGAFYHANILSTFSLLVLPYFVARSRGGTIDAKLSAIVAALLSALQLWSGSVTGSCLVIGTLVFWLFRRQRSTAIVAALLSAGLPMLFNLWGGWPAVLGYPLLFLFLLTLNLTSPQWSRHFVVVALYLATLAFTVGAFTLLTPTVNGPVAVQVRNNSLRARLDFYQAAFQLMARQPVVGIGPGGFAREYPSFQSSVRYYSNYVHCFPLEVWLEWGTLGAGFAFMGIGFALRRTGPLNQLEHQTWLWSFLLLGLHSLTDVQSQFPYLFAVVVIGWLALPDSGADEDLPRGGVADALTRSLLTLLLLFLMVLNSLRVLALYERSVAISLARSGEPGLKKVAHDLITSSTETLPFDAETWYLAAQLARSRTDKSGSKVAVEQALVLDPRWAGPLNLRFEVEPSRRTTEESEAALRVDPVNYPNFYLYQAEALVHRRKLDEAEAVLKEQAKAYDPQLLNTLADFRANDLESQMANYWLLLAIVEEKLGRNLEAESSFRKALYFCRNRQTSFRALLDYPRTARIEVGPLVRDLLSQVREQVPSDDLPPAVQGTTQNVF